MTWCFFISVISNHNHTMIIKSWLTLLGHFHSYDWTRQWCWRWIQTRRRRQRTDPIVSSSWGKKWWRPWGLRVPQKLGSPWSPQSGKIQSYRGHTSKVWRWRGIPAGRKFWAWAFWAKSLFPNHFVVNSSSSSSFLWQIDEKCEYEWENDFCTINCKVGRTVTK
jgi:hypothetical protein